MIIKLLRKATLLSVLFFPTFILLSCEKEADNSLGKNIQPDDDFIGAFRVDTFAITSKTIDADSLFSDELSANLIGSYNDPVFGQVDCGTYAQIRLSSEKVDFKDISDIAIDSVVFSMAYNGSYYGDTNSTLQFKVQRLNEMMYVDSIYYSNKKFDVFSEVLNEDENQSYAIRPKTPLKLGKDTAASPQIRIRLKNSLGQEFINRSNTVDLLNNVYFTTWFKGLYISANQVSASGQGVIPYFNPVSVYSKLAIHYHHISKPDTVVFNVPINSASARVTSFKQEYAGTPVQMQLNGSVSGEQEVYVQSGGGTKVELKIPYLEQIADSGKLIVNKAELILPVVPGSGSPFKYHDRLLLQALKADGTREVIIDQLEGDAFFGGFYNPVDNAYHFTITRYIQQILNGTKENYGIQVIAASSGINANRTILAGSNNSLAKPKFKLTYTKP